MHIAYIGIDNKGMNMYSYNFLAKIRRYLSTHDIFAILLYGVLIPIYSAPY